MVGRGISLLFPDFVPRRPGGNPPRGALFPDRRELLAKLKSPGMPDNNAPAQKLGKEPVPRGGFVA